MFIAHRGNDRHEYRENSEQAIIYSLNQPYIDGIECDVRLTKDNKIILSHNSLIDFESNGNGFIHNLNLEELLEYHFHDEKITILEELLSKINTKKLLLLEIKEERNFMVDDWIEALYPILLKYKNLNIYLCSFNYQLILKLKETFTIPIGLIVGYTTNIEKETKFFDFIMYYYKSFQYTHKLTMVWTINTIKQYEKYKYRTSYIITDKAYEFV